MALYLLMIGDESFYGVRRRLDVLLPQAPRAAFSHVQSGLAPVAVPSCIPTLLHRACSHASQNLPRQLTFLGLELVFGEDPSACVHGIRNSDLYAQLFPQAERTVGHQPLDPFHLS